MQNNYWKNSIPNRHGIDIEQVIEWPIKIKQKIFFFDDAEKHSITPQYRGEVNKN